MSDHEAQQATPAAELERQIMSATVPKNEREWWAWREIERLRAERQWETIDTAPTGDDDFFLVCCDDPADDRAPFVVRGSIFKSARQARTPGHLSLHHLTHWQALPAKPSR